MIKFTSEIFMIGINPVVDPPDPVMTELFVQTGRSKGPIPVRGRLHGAPFVQTLVKYKGAWRLYINGPMLKDSGLTVGDKASIEIEFDPRPRDVPMPPKLAEALKCDPAARTAYDELPPSRRKEISRYLGSLKTAAAIDKNVERIMRHLRGEKTGAQHVLTRRKKG
jgi:hypothetical protein